MMAKSKIESHILSNDPQGLSSSSSEQGSNIIIDEDSGKRYLKTKTGALLPMNDEDNQELDYDDL